MNGEVVEVIAAEESDMVYYGVVLSSEKAAADSTTSTSSTSVQIATRVACSDGVERTFYHSGSTYSAGRLVTTTVNNGETQLKSLSKRSLEGTVSQDGTTFAGYEFAADVEILDTDSEGGYARIYPSRLAGARLESDDVYYYSLDENGHIDLLILNEATGDTLTYVYLTTAERGGGDSTSGSYTYLLDGERTTVTTSGKTLGASYGPARLTIEDGQLTAVRELEQIRNPDSVTQSGVTKDGESWLFWDDCAVYLYENAQYSLLSLTELRNNSGSYSITRYYDKDTDEGGRIRIVIARPQ